MDMPSINRMAIARQLNEAISNLHQMSATNIATFINLQHLNVVAISEFQRLFINLPKI